jgi:hypothetical protein
MPDKDIVELGETGNVWKASCAVSRAVGFAAWGRRFGRQGRYLHVAHCGGPNFSKPKLKTRVEARIIHADTQGMRQEARK